MSRLPSILIVDDEAVMIVFLELLLQRNGFEIIDSVSTGDEAILLARNKRPDVVLMDIRLVGELDGIDTARQINNEHKTEVVFISGYSNQETLKRAEDVHPVAFVFKPFEISELLEIMRKLHN